MKKISVNLDNRSYPIHIESGLVDQIPTHLSVKNNGEKWVIFSHHMLMELFGFSIQEKLNLSGFDCNYITLPSGETAKSLNEFSRIMNQLVEMGCDRSTIILALGGGVVGDVAGFVASTFMRGIRYFQIPTTFLAMVDSSIGGKTGINIAQGKNLLGTVYQPSGVLIDPNLLHSLPKKEVVSGLGEVIKYGAIHDKSFLEKVSGWLDDLNSFPFETAIEISCKIKAKIVAKDEREGGLRRILNFGHTVGHAIEAHLGYGKIKHGEAVAYGMLCAGWISKEMGLLPKEELKTLSSIIKKLPLPKLPFLDSDLLMPYIKTDKKTEKGLIHFVVLERLGVAKTSTDITIGLMKKSIKSLR